MFTKFFDGKVQLIDPELVVNVIFEYEDSTKQKQKRKKRNAPKKLIGLWAGRKICDGGRRNLSVYSLKTREYISTTSMSAECSFLAANMALTKKGKVVFDPFCGTGSILVSCAHFGSSTLGSDIDIRVIRGKKKGDKNVYSNFKQYGIEKQSDFSQMSRTDIFYNFFDAVVTDLPYGVRESTKKIGRNREIFVQESRKKDHIPSRIAYTPTEMILDLLNFSAKALVMGGRLVYWTAESPGNLVVPRHNSLKLLFHNKMFINSKMHRRLMVYEKVEKYRTLKKLNILIPNMREELLK